MIFQHPAQISSGHPLPIPYTLYAPAPPSFSSLPFSSDYRCSLPYLTGKDIHSSYRRSQLKSFDTIPDDVLLEIFDFYADEDMDKLRNQSVEEWIRLAHVCRRWRSIVFQSPLRLNLKLICTPFTPTRHMMDIWPPFPFPLIIRDSHSLYSVDPSIVDNIIAALEHNDRVCNIDLTYSKFLNTTSAAVLRKPFPKLTFLRLRNISRPYEGLELILPDSFLGGFAPRLRSFFLEYVSFPGLQKLLLSATHLVHLTLNAVPRSGYVPPGALASSLPALTSLESFTLHFRYPPPRSALESRQPPLPCLTRSILPKLTKIDFQGASEYLEEILTRIDAPLLDQMHITFFNQIIFNTPRLFQFISRTPTLRSQEKGHITFKPSVITIKFSSPSSNDDVLNVGIRCTPSEWQLSSMEQVCTSFLPPVSTLDNLYITENRFERQLWQDDVENTLWLDFLRPFVAVKNLYISDDLVPRIAPALRELVGGRTTEVLPALDNIFLEGFLPLTGRPLQEGIENFVAARLLTSRPVAVSRWERGIYW